jgi:hypothetical protein
VIEKQRFGELCCLYLQGEVNIIENRIILLYMMLILRGVPYRATSDEGSFTPNLYFCSSRQFNSSPENHYYPKQ